MNESAMTQTEKTYAQLYREANRQRLRELGRAYYAAHRVAILGKSKRDEPRRRPRKNAGS